MRSPRLLYEPLTAAHAMPLFPVLSPKEVWTHIGPSEAKTLDALTARFARMAAGSPPGRSGERWINFAVRLAESGAYCGRIEAAVHGDWAEIAYLFGPAFWGQGLATEATSWLREHLIECFQVRELWAATRPRTTRPVACSSGSGSVQAPPTRHLGSADPEDLVYCWRE